MRQAAGRTGYLGLGSNVADRLASLQTAVAELAGSGVRVTASSSVYETEPVGEVTEQREFLNACLRIDTTLGPLALLGRAKDVERRLGRPAAGVRHGPRPIDVDVLLLGDVQFRHPQLTLPHPQTVTRRFVLIPLLELNPDLRLPGGSPLSEALDALGPGQAVRRFSDPLRL